MENYSIKSNYINQTNLKRNKMNTQTNIEIIIIEETDFYTAEIYIDDILDSTKTSSTKDELNDLIKNHIKYIS